MKHQAYILLAMVFTCFLILFTIPQNTLSKESSKKSETNMLSTTPKSNTLKAPLKSVSHPPLIIRQILLKKGTIHVALESSAKMRRIDYSTIKLRVKTKEHKIPGNWTLLKVDKKRKLLLKKGIVLFDTKMKLKKRGIVQATLTKGMWRANKNATLGSIAITKTTSMKTKIVASTKPMATTKKMPETKIQGQAPQVKPGTDKPIVPMISKNTAKKLSSRTNSSVSERVEASALEGEDDDIYRNMGIGISLPMRGHNYKFGDIINVRYAGSRELEPGMPITFRLMRGGLIVDTKTRTLPHYVVERVGVDGTVGTTPVFETFEWRIPATAPATGHYYIHGIQQETGAVGFGHYFEVSSRFSVVENSRGEMHLPINIIEPVAEDEVILGSSRPIVWTMPETDEPGNCGNRATLSAIREGTDHEIRLTQINTEPGSNTWDWPVSPENVAPGRYHIKIESSEGCTIRGAAFKIKSCDYALDSATFLNDRTRFEGHPLSSGIDASDGSTISDTFRVKVLWNRVEPPTTFMTGTEWSNKITVKSILTNETISIPQEGINFDYTTAVGFGPGPGDTRVSYIFVDVPFEFARDDIGRMVNASGKIPLEFKFEPAGTSVDTDPGNNRFEADINVSSAEIADLQIMFYIDEFSAPRHSYYPSSATHYEYHFNQLIRTRNATVDDFMGGAPADLLNVPVAWYIEYSTGSGWNHVSSGRSSIPAVGGEWPAPDSSTSLPVVEGSFTVPIDQPDRIYRLRMVIDPDHEYIDLDRSSNEFSNTLNLPD
jgi:hypothetical protein